MGSAKSAVASVWSAGLDYARDASPKGISRFQRVYLALSFIALWVLASYVATAGIESVIGESVMATGFVAAALIVARVLIPGSSLAFIRDSTSATVKLALMLNVLTSILLLIIVGGVWKAQVTIIATVLGITVVAAWVFCGIAWPISSQVYRLFFGDNSAPAADSIARQGRTIKHD
jgi:hypothetical protein